MDRTCQYDENKLDFYLDLRMTRSIIEISSFIHSLSVLCIQCKRAWYYWCKIILNKVSLYNVLKMTYLFMPLCVIMRKQHLKCIFVCFRNILSFLIHYVQAHDTPILLNNYKETPWNQLQLFVFSSCLLAFASSQICCLNASYQK